MTAPLVGDIWYQYKDVVYAPMLDEFENPCGPSRIEVKLLMWRVVKVNPQSVWVVRTYPNEPFYGVKEFDAAYLRAYRTLMYNGSKRKPAHPSKAEALRSFLAKKRAQVRIHSAKVARAEKAMELAKVLYEKD